MIARCLRHRAPVLWLLLPFMGGVVLGRFTPAIVAGGWWLGGAALAAVGAWWKRERPYAWAAFLLLSLLLAGMGAYPLHRQRIEAWAMLPKRELTLEIEVEQLYSDHGDKSSLSGVFRIVHANDPVGELRGQRAHGQFRLGKKQPRPERGETIKVVGLISAVPENSPLASFEGYLIGAGINFQISRGVVLGRLHPPSPYASLRNATAAKFARCLERGLEARPDLIPIYAGMVMGRASAMNDDQKNAFSRSGTMHLFSVGGLHVAVVALALHAVLGLCRVPSGWRWLVLAPLLWFYVDLSGGSPAAYRAFTTALLVEAGRSLHRPLSSLSTLATAALVALLVQPLQLFSASFQFSYSIAVAILLLGLPLSTMIEHHLKPFQSLPTVLWRPHHHAADWLVRSTIGSLTISLTASLTGELCTLLYFGLLTPGATIANLLAIPLSSLAIIAGIVGTMAATIGLGYVTILMNQAAGLVLASMVYSLSPYSTLPGVAFQGTFPSVAAGFSILAAILSLLLAGYACRWRPRKFWLPLPFAVVALGLVLFVRFL